MRTIKFRGKRIDNGEWVYGYLVIDPNGKARIYWKPFEECSTNTYHFVDPATVGKFTGLLDKNGREIYEGDLFMDSLGTRVHVVWSEESNGWALRSTSWAFEHFFGEACDNTAIEIIGTIHD